MSTITTKSGAKIFYKDWGQGQPIVFSHGWPLTADAWDGQMLFFLENGFRVIAHDRRGHGRSSQTWENNTMDQYADDLAALIEELDLQDIILIGHSTGGGEITRYVGRHGTSRVAKVVLVGAVPPIMIQSEKNPKGVPRDIFDQTRQGVMNNRAQFFKDFTLPFYGYNRDGAKISEGVRESFWMQGMVGGIKSIYDSIEQFSESDFHEDLKKFDVPTLIIHGEDDQIVPIAISGMLTSKLVKDCEFKIYKGAPHGLTVTLQDQFNGDVLKFIQSGAQVDKSPNLRKSRPDQPDMMAH